MNQLRSQISAVRQELDDFNQRMMWDLLNYQISQIKTDLKGALICASIWFLGLVVTCFEPMPLWMHFLPLTFYTLMVSIYIYFIRKWRKRLRDCKIKLALIRLGVDISDLP